MHFYSFVSLVCRCWCPRFSVRHVAFLLMCLPGLSLLVRPFPLAMHFYSFVCQVCPCSVSIHLSRRSVTAGVRPFWPCSISMHLSPRPSSLNYAAFGLSWCPPLSVGHAAFLWICLPGLSLLVSALFRWPCNIWPRSVFICFVGLSLVVSALFRSPCASIQLSPRSVHVAFLFICLPGLLRWPCRISIYLSPRAVTAGVRPFPLAMQHFYSFVSRWPRSVTPGGRPFPLAM